MSYTVKIDDDLDYYEGPASGPPADHAGTHVTGGGDTVTDAVAAGNSGLMSGADKTKLDGIASGAEVNVNADWSAGSGDAQILNKPTSMTPTTHNTTHVTGGSDIIADAVAAGNSGLMSGADKTRIGELSSVSSPIFATVKLSNLTDGYHPYHVSDAAGLANGPIWTNGSLVGIGQATVTSGYTVDVNGFIRTVQTVDQAASASVHAEQTASTLQDGSASTGTSELFDNQWEAMKFTASAAHNMRSIHVRLKSSATLTNTTATITAYIYADSNPTGSGGSPTGAALATSTTTVKFANFTTTMTTFSFGILSLALTNGNHYWIVLKWSEAPAGGTISIDTAAAGTGEWSKSADGSAWTNEDSKRGWFKVLGRTLYGVYGFSSNSVGVYGSSVNSYAMYGVSVNQIAIYGYSTNGYGLFGESVNSYGVSGRSTNSFGFVGSSVNSYGIYASSTNSIGMNAFSTNSYAAYFSRNTATPTSAVPVVYINQDHASDTNPALLVKCDGSGDMLQLSDGGTLSLVYKDTGLLGIATASPVCRLEVEDGGTSKDFLVKITQDDSGVWALIIGNDTYSTTDTNGLRFYVSNSGNAYIDWTGASLTFGGGTAGQDIELEFYGETNTGYLSWMEDEDYFEFWDDVLIDTNYALYFRDTAIGVYSQADTFLDLYADGGIRIGDSSAGAPTNYAKFAPDGELNLVGTARVTKDVQLPLSGFGKGAAAPGDVYLGNYFGYEFTTNDTIYLSTEIPYDRDPSADLVIEIHWYINEAVGSPVKEVAWEVYYTCTKENGTELVDAVSATLPSGDIVIPTLAKALTETSFTIPAAAIDADDVIGIIIKRVAIADGTAPTAKPVIVGAMLEYIANKLGEAT